MNAQTIARKLEAELQKQTPDSTTEAVIAEATAFLAQVQPTMKAWFQDRIELLESRVFNATFA